MLNDASSTKLVLRMPLEQIAPIYETANQNNLTLFAHLAGVIGTRLNLSAMSIDLSPSCQYLRLSLTMSVSEAMKLQAAAQAKRVSAGDWLAHLLAQNTPVAPPKDLSPIGAKSKAQQQYK